jgi:glutamine amidotransferase
MPDLLDETTEQRLLNGAECNPDGHGWAVVTGNRIVTGKSMSDKDAIAGFRDAYASATGPALFHSRWATHGSKTLANVHPFPVRKLEDTYVAHNGILPEAAHPRGADLRSDTRIFADDILPIRYKRLDNPNVRRNLSQWLKGNKIAVLTTNPRFSRNLYLFGLEMGEWLDGVWYSNGDHSGWARYFSRHYQPAEDEECLWCHARNVNAWAICETCGTCQDCFEPQDTCQCFSPIRHRPDEEEESHGPLALEAPKHEDDYPVILGPKSGTGYDSALGREYATAVEVEPGNSVQAPSPVAFNAASFYRWPDGAWKKFPAPAHEPVKECFGAGGVDRCGGNHLEVSV